MNPEKENEILDIIKTSVKPEVFALRMNEVATRVMNIIIGDTKAHEKMRAEIVKHGVAAVSPILIIDYVTGTELKTEVVDIHDVMKRDKADEIMSGMEDLGRQWFTSRTLPVSSIFMIAAISLEPVSKIPEAKEEATQAILLEGLTFAGVSNRIIFKTKVVKDKLEMSQADFGSDQVKEEIGRDFLKSFFMGYMQMVKTMKDGKIGKENNTTH